MAVKKSTAARPYDAGLAEAQAELRTKILAAAPNIVGKLIEQAESGKTDAAKFLFDIAGLLDFENVAPPTIDPSQTLSGIVLKRLREAQISAKQANSKRPGESDNTCVQSYPLERRITDT